MILPLSQNDDNLKTILTEDALVWSIFEVCLKSKHNFKHTDNEGKNFLHYAAKSGNYFGFEHAYNTLSRHDVMSILTQKDITWKTPVDEIFQAMQKRKTFDPIRIPEGCEITDVFYTKCPKKFETILTNHEMCILKTLFYLYQKEGFEKFNVSELLSVAILMLKVYAKQQFQYVVQNNPQLLYFITEYQGPHIAELLLTKDNALKCDGSFSPLHEIIMNDRNTQSMYYNHDILNKYLTDYSCTMLDWCFDKDGYNLLHRAVMGGNFLGTQFLMIKGMKLLHSSRHGHSALQILFDKAPFLENGVMPLRYSDSSPYQVLQFVSKNSTEELIIDYSSALQFDVTAVFLLENAYRSGPSRRRKIEALLCRPNKRHLSLVHLAAAKGFIGFLKKCVLLFDSDTIMKILDCSDFNKITPYYLARIYKQESVMKWMISIRVPEPNQTWKLKVC
ncbi:unnamed protein product [Mytilus edulis]|uniref:Uncharacterized protein n=1 Tax=Mytilus edulis TaxID=6550 RepID=A0A8S3VJ76_MYTED|nr:unnamed protein product [Mytilus edulis]